jgi:N-acetylneuraminate synthase
MCGNSHSGRRNFLPREIEYLDSYVRGVYAKRSLTPGQYLTEDDFYMAIPLRKGQLSSRELMLGNFGHKILTSCRKDEPILVEMIETPYSQNGDALEYFKNRGL